MRSNLVKIDDEKLNGLSFSPCAGGAVGNQVLLPVELEFVDPDPSQITHFEFADFRILTNRLDDILNRKLQRLT